MHETPETHGVYYLSDKQDRVLYVGKANNIRKRVFQHFRKISVKANNIYNFVDKLHYEETGNELVALLLELYEIKRLRPELNKAMKRHNYKYAIYRNPKAKDAKGVYLVAQNNKNNDFKYDKLKLFATKSGADMYIQDYILEHEVCASIFKSRSTPYACLCEDSCDSFVNHMEEFSSTFEKHVKNEFENDFVIILPGRTEEESAFVMIHEKRFWGFGYIPYDESLTSREHWNDYISYQFWYPEANGLIKTYLSKHFCEVIDLD